MWTGEEWREWRLFFQLFFWFPFLCHSPWANHDASVTCRSSMKLSIPSLQASVSHPWSMLVLPISSKDPHFLQGKEETAAGLWSPWGLSPRENSNRCDTLKWHFLLITTTLWKCLFDSQKYCLLNYCPFKQNSAWTLCPVGMWRRKGCVGQLLLSTPGRTVASSSVPDSAHICCRHPTELGRHTELQSLSLCHSLRVWNGLVTIDF